MNHAVLGYVKVMQLSATLPNFPLDYSRIRKMFVIRTCNHLSTVQFSQNTMQGIFFFIDCLHQSQRQSYLIWTFLLGKQRIIGMGNYRNKISKVISQYLNPIIYRYGHGILYADTNMGCQTRQPFNIQTQRHKYTHIHTHTHISKNICIYINNSNKHMYWVTIHI